MNIKNELSKAIPAELFVKFKDVDFIHIAECLNIEKDLRKRRASLNKYIRIILDEAIKIEQNYQLSKAIVVGNKYLLRKYKSKKTEVSQ